MNTRTENHILPISHGGLPILTDAENGWLNAPVGITPGVGLTLVPSGHPHPEQSLRLPQGYCSVCLSKLGGHSGHAHAFVPVTISAEGRNENGIKSTHHFFLNLEPTLENLRIAQRALSDACDRALREMARWSEPDPAPEPQAKDPTTMETPL